MDDTMVIYREYWFFLIVKMLMNKVIFIGFRGSGRPLDPPLVCCVCFAAQKDFVVKVIKNGRRKVTKIGSGKNPCHIFQENVNLRLHYTLRFPTRLEVS